MQKSTLQKFLRKYHLDGSIESVTITSSDDEVSTAFADESKTLIGMISMTDIPIPSGEYSLYNTSQLLKFMSILENEIDLNIKKTGNTPSSIEFKDSNKTKINFVLASKDVIPKQPEVKGLPEFEHKIEFDTDVIDRFIKAKGAMSDESVVTFKDDKMYLGYNEHNSNSISFTIDTNLEFSEPVKFNAEHIKSIFANNKDMSSMTIEVSNRGIARIKFTDEGCTCDYFVFKIK